MLEEEIRQGDMEREQLRIETQRLRDELSDLRVEFDITVEKLHHTEAALERSHSKKVPLSTNPARPRSPTSEVSAITPPSPTVSTPPAHKSEASDMPTPPSPPLSDANGHNRPPPKTRFHSQALRPQPLPEAGSTPRPLKIGTRLPRHSRGPSLGGQGLSLMSTSNKMGPPPRTKPTTANAPAPTEGLPRSQSLHQIKGLIGRMQKIEARVHSVRSKLPPPSTRTASPRNSPRALGVSAAATDSGLNMPASVTVRSARKRTSNVSALSNPAEHLDTTGISKRLSFGVLAGQDRPTSSSGRPSSRASNTSASEFARPGSRMGMTAVAGNGTTASMRTARPRSSMGGATISEEGRRSTLDRSGIPTPGKRRESGAAASASGHARRTSQAFVGSMAPPPPRKTGIGETY